MSTRGAPRGNQNAVKEDGKTSRLIVRCTPADKAAWVKSASGRTLAEWVTETLNKSARVEK